MLSRCGFLRLPGPDFCPILGPMDDSIVTTLNSMVEAALCPSLALVSPVLPDVYLMLKVKAALQPDHLLPSLIEGSAS